MENKTIVSIIINNYNYGRFLSKAIDSALKQTYSPIEVIVVDDGSTDNSREIISSYGSQIIPICKENGGQGSAFNAGFAASCGEIICFLDADDVFIKEKVASIVEIFNINSEIDWCFHAINLVDEKTNKLIGRNRERNSRKCDFRTNAIKGKINFYAPPTTALCFRKSFLKQILPMLETKATKLCADNYIATAASALSLGFYLDKELAIQYLHGNNGFKNNRNLDKLIYLKKVVVAYALRSKFPMLAKYANRQFAVGFTYLMKDKELQLEYKYLTDAYWSHTTLIEKCEIFALLFYYRLPRKRKSIFITVKN